MSFNEDEDMSASVCPHLGLADDPDSHATYATEAHRCHRMPNPTRVASNHQETFCLVSNHVACPVFLGEGIPGAQRSSSAAPVTAPLPRPGANRGQQAGRAPNAPAQPQTRGSATTSATPGGRKPRDPGSLGPRPRPGGISMPAATIGLFALAVIIIGITVFILNNSGGGDAKVSPAQQFETQQALGKTQQAQTKPASTTPPTVNGQTPRPGQTPGTPSTPGTASGSTTPTASGKDYVVKSGDFCGTIAEANKVTLEALLKANNMTEDDCTKLQVGQKLKLP